MRILIADDYEAVRKGVNAIVGSCEDLEVCGEAANGREAVDKAVKLNPDLIILDISMPILSGLEAAEAIKKVLPHIPILILSMHDGKQVIEQAKRIGVQGYVTKSQAGTTLLDAIYSLLRRETFFPHEV